jgi:hypothetical protein
MAGRPEPVNGYKNSYVCLEVYWFSKKFLDTSEGD